MNRALLVLFAILLLAGSASAALTDGITSYYTWDAGTGTTVADNLSNNTGTLSNSAGWTASSKLGPYAMGSANTYYTSYGTSSSLSVGGDITIAAWIYPTANDGVIMGDWVGAQRNYLFSLWSTGKLYADSGTGAGSSTPSYIFTTETIPLNTWTHVAYVRDGNTLRVYINGNASNTASITGYTGATTTNNVVAGASATGTGIFKGTIDELGFWGRTLNATEISELYNNGTGIQYPFTPPVPGNITNITLTAVDAYDGSSITTFNASLTNTSGTYTFSTTNGTINTNIDDTTGPYNITFNAANYFSNSTPSVDVSSGSVQGSLAQAFVSFSCFEKHTNTSLNCTQPGPLPRQADSYTDQVNVTGYHPVDYSYTLSALDYYRSSFSYSAGWDNPEHMNDGNFSTFADPTTTAYAYWNYTRVGNASFAYKGGLDAETSTYLPAACQYSSTLQIRAEGYVPSGIGISRVYWTCWDGSSWVNFATNSNQNNVYEQSYAGSEPALEVYGFYDHELTVTAEDYLGASLSNFTLWVNSSLVNYTVTDNNTGSVVLGLLQGYNYTIEISENVPSGVERNNSIESTIINVPEDPSSSSQSYQFNLTFPTLTITVLDEDTGVPAPGNTTLTFTASNSSFTKTVVNGSGVFNASDSIPSGTYSVRFENDDYADRVYNLTYNREFPQSLTAYLVNTSSPNVVFILENRDTRNVVEAATITVQRFINGTLTTVNVLESDITGRTAFDYLSNQEYRFQITHPDYTAKNFTLNPILFPSYTILMDSPTTVGETTGDYSGIGFVFNTVRFVEGSPAGLTATVSDASGSLVSYGFNITVNGASVDSQSGTNAYGSIISSNANIPETPYNGTAVIDYYYQRSDGITHTFRAIYSVEQVNPYSNQTWVGNRDLAADIPILDRIVVVTIILGAVGALAFTFGGLTSAAIGMMLIMGFFAFTGFISGWVFAVPIIGLFFLLIGREAQ